ncbi:restriction endonuclease subunit S [Pseudocnuella soli]|uniref:restriction endonuclease subunit S n=1 Tax=Pseudocnuella soli TaxID=2502779 RepID=UPI001048E366|nr:restriction endonuclease subunit S [Pseudocnuella soli]
MKEEQSMNGLPRDWRRVKVNDVCLNIVGGGTPSTQKPEYWQGDIPWISSADIYGIKDLKPRRKITLEAVKNSATNVLPKGGIVVVTRVGLGKLAVAPYELCFSQDSQGLILKKDLISTEYALLVLHQEVQNFKHQSRGTTINGVTKKQLAELEIALPPLEIQKQLVSKIDELFSELDKGIEELKTAQQQLKVYRQAVLKWAFEGKLTNEEVKDGELPEGWNTLRFSQLFSGTPQNGLYKPSSEYGSGTPIMRIDGFYDGLILDDYEYKRVKLAAAEIEKYELCVGDILINRVNSMSHLGKCGLVKSLKERTVFESNIMKVQVKTTEVLPEYITFYLSSKRGVKELTKNAKHAVNQASINQTDVSNSLIPICSIEEQQQIVQEIESRLSVCDKIEETIADSLKQAEALRQSILKKAFEGILL